MQDVMKDAIDYYGENNQIIVAIEEMAELQKELVKHLRGIGDRGNIIEELVDVQIMMDQLTMIFEMQDIERIIITTHKLHRLAGRIRKERSRYGKA